ncbi:MAG: CHAD domain-containing protein [Campylobacterales bacterium]
MAYHINLSKNIEKEVQDALDFYLLDVLHTLSDSKITQAKKIHNIRKSFKKIRAILKLAKYDLKDRETYVTQNNYYKYAGKRFSDSRDHLVLKKTLNKIAEKYDIKDKIEFSSLESLNTNVNSDKFTVLEKEIQLKREYLNIYKLKKKKRPLKAGLKKIYKKLIKNRKKAYSTYKDSDFHEWRKATKNYMYQSKLFKNTLPKKLKKKTKNLKKLADLLGLDHDISVLKEFILNQNKKNTSIIYYLEREQSILRAEASKIRLEALKKIHKKHL